MLNLNKKQKKYLKKNLHKKSLNKIATDLNISSVRIGEFLKKQWGKDKYRKFVLSQSKAKKKITIQTKVINFNFKKWFKKNILFCGILTSLVLISYVNSLNNDFVSDDVDGILNNPTLDKLGCLLVPRPSSFLRILFYFLINKIFGRQPWAFRLLNISLHLGTVLAVYLLVYLLLDRLTAFFSAAILAVHPIQIEAVSWISGGGHVQYAFFIILSFIAYLLVNKNKDNYYWSLVFFVLAMLSSEKAIIFPLIFLLFILVLGRLKEDWKKLIFPFVFSGIFVVIFVFLALKRISALQTDYYQGQEGVLNPFVQIPVAIISYIKLIFWPKDLTLYHSELRFSLGSYSLILILFLFFLGTIIYFFKRNKQIFFWLSLFIISLLPTLTPFGISWIVAERYVYLGAIGIFVVLGISFRRLSELKKIGEFSYGLFTIVILLFLIRTIYRNGDWQNQDRLWLSAAKTSPSSPQNHNNLGDLYGRRGEHQKAIAEYKKAIEINQGYADAFHNLANTYQQMGQNEQAIENYHKALELNPKLWQSHQMLAAIFWSQKNFKEAKKETEEAIKINPQESNLYLNLGLIYFQLKEFDQAKKAAEQALFLEPGNLRAKKFLQDLLKQ